MKNRVRLVMAVACLAVFCQAGSMEAAAYKYTDLKMGFPNDPANYVEALTDANQIVGYYTMGAPNGGTQGYYCDLVKGSFIWLQSINQSYPNSYALGINKLGQIVGKCANSQNTVYVACVWTNPSQAPTMLSQLSNYTSGQASAINDNGLIIGFSYNNEGSQRACKWTITAPDQPVDLNTLGGTDSSANGVNSAGQIVGMAYNTEQEYAACLWNPGQQPQDLNISLWAPFAVGINSQGNVLGFGQELNPPMAAFYWDHQTAQTQVFSGCMEAVGPSNANQVAGNWGFGRSGVFSWTPSGGQKDLNTLIVNLPQGVTVTKVTLMSPKGNIIGVHSDGNSCLLTPVAASPGVGLLLLE
jgi:probable HAF family extracellular repeat protein